MRASKKVAEALAATPPQPAADAAIPNEVIDRWIAARTDRAHSPVGYTAMVDLYADFTAWHEASRAEIDTPNDAAFATALAGAPRIRFEMLPVRRAFQTAALSLCASLTLRPALRSVA